ncbi:MAG: NAD(P)H-dependent oxidoreductase subunit E [Rectinemataceae bacterium]
MSAASQAQVKNVERNSLDAIIKKKQGRPGALLGILEEAQGLEEHRYLSEICLRQIAEGLDLPLSQVYSVATFYSYFNLKPQGLHSVVVCRGTACHTRGSLELLVEAVDRLGIEGFREEEENSATTLDGFASVRTVACFGQCALAPVVEIDGEMMSRMTVGRLVSALAKLRKGGPK